MAALVAGVRRRDPRHPLVANDGPDPAVADYGPGMEELASGEVALDDDTEAPYRCHEP